MKGHAVLTSSASDEWATPDDFFAVVDSEFGFTLDAAATAENTKTRRFIDQAEDALRVSWGINGERIWLNPPYSLVGAFMDRAVQMAAQGNIIACLVPARTDTRWWHRTTERAAEVRLLRGRLRFGDATGSAPFPSALVIFNDAARAEIPIDRPSIYNWDWRATLSASGV